MFYQILAYTICGKIEKSLTKAIDLETVTDNPPIRTYVNKIQSRITFKIKRGYYLKLLTSKTLKLLGITKNKKIRMKRVTMCLILELLKEHPLKYREQLLSTRFESFVYIA